MRPQSSLLVTWALNSPVGPERDPFCMQSRPGSLGSSQVCVWGGMGSPRLRLEHCWRTGAHLMALAPLQGLQRSAISCLHHLFPRLTRESQGLNPHGCGRLRHRNATWVKCLLPALQLEGSPFLELPVPFICASASKTLVAANLVTWSALVLRVSRA